MFQLKKETFQVDATCKIVRAEEIAALVEAQEVIQAAKQEVERIKAEATQVYEAEKKRGYEEGLAEGKMRMAEQMMSMAAKTVDYFASVETKVVEIVTNALKRILGSVNEDELIVRVVRNALAVARNQKQVTLRVSPPQVDMLKQKVNEILADYPGITCLDVVGDSRLSKGGCILETETGIVDASVDVQVEAIRKALVKSFRRSA